MSRVSMQVTRGEAGAARWRGRRQQRLSACLPCRMRIALSREPPMRCMTTKLERGVCALSVTDTKPSHNRSVRSGTCRRGGARRGGRGRNGGVEVWR